MDPTQFPRHPHDLNRYGQALKQSAFTIVGVAGGAGGTVLAQSGRSSKFLTTSWIVGIQLSATFCVNTTAPKFIAVALEGAALQELNTSSNMLLTLAHALGTTTSINVPISKGGAMWFQWPFLPYIDTGCCLAGYASNDIAAGERIIGVANCFYVVAPQRIPGR